MTTEEWVELYRDIGIQADFSALRIPEKKPGFDRLIVVAQRMTPQLLYDKCTELFPCWKDTSGNLDDVVILSKNLPSVRWFRDRVEADEELKNFSANDLEKKNIPGITLEERLLYEAKYFKETGQHLDLKNWTLCTGSRYSDGGVPSVSWGSDGLEVDWYPPGYHGDYLRSREAVS